MIIYIDCESRVSINSLAVNKINLVKVITQFLAGKMFYVYRIVLNEFYIRFNRRLYFPNTKTKIIYRSYGIEKIFPYHILTDTDSTSLLFHIVCSEENSILDHKFREIIFELIVPNYIISRFDTSHEYWEKFGVRDKTLE